MVRTAFVAACFVVLPSYAFAQTSSVTIPPQTAGGEMLPKPLKPLEIPDFEYPLEPLLANQEGEVSLNLLIDSMGQVAYAQITKFSDSGPLNRSAARIAKANWRFEPGKKEGQPSLSALKVDVAWKLPLRRADEIYAQMMGLPVANKSIVYPKPLGETHRMFTGDYPLPSLQKGEQGEVALHVQVLDTGAVGEVQIVDSSGFEGLDKAAAAAIKARFKYEAGMIDGMPATIWTDQLISFYITSGPLRGRPRFCHSRPILGSSSRVNSDGSGGAIPVSQWFHLIRDGSIDDVLLQTREGWMHASPAYVRSVSAAARNAPSVDVVGTQVTGSLFSKAQARRPDSCWYNVEINVSSNP